MQTIIEYKIVGYSHAAPIYRIMMIGVIYLFKFCNGKAIVVDREGIPLRNQPGNKNPFHRAFRKWLRKGANVKGGYFCVF